jgi:hypothetical protein
VRIVRDHLEFARAHVTFRPTSTIAKICLALGSDAKFRGIASSKRRALAPGAGKGSSGETWAEAWAKSDVAPLGRCWSNSDNGHVVGMDS